MSKYKGFEGLMDFEVDNSRSKIINAAIYKFSVDGYVTSTTKDIAKLAGVSEALLFKYYGNKQKLLGAISIEIMEKRIQTLFKFRLEELMNGALNFNKSSFKTIIKDKFRYMAENSGYMKIIFIEMGFNSQENIEILRAMIDDLFGQLERFIKILQVGGVIKKELPPRTVLRSFSSSLAFLMADMRILETPLDFNEEIEYIVDIFLEGVGTHE